MQANKPITLIATIGISPAVLTETIGALVEQGYSSISRIIILTTQRGYHDCVQALFENNHFKACCREYGIDPYQIDFQAQTGIRVPVNPSTDEWLSDMRNANEDQLFAELVQETVREETSNKRNHVFASIAGGRKTMGAHLMAAMQLYGREGDRLLHILVNEAHEQCRAFYYKTKNSFICTDSSGRSVDAKDAVIDLIDIPFLRLQSALSSSGIDFSRLRYSELLNQLNEQLRLANSIKFRSIEIDFKKGEVLVNRTISCKHEPRVIALFGLILLFKKLNVNNGVFKPNIMLDIEAPPHLRLQHILWFAFFGFCNSRIEEDKILLDSLGFKTKYYSKLKSELFKEVIKPIVLNVLKSDGYTRDIEQITNDSFINYETKTRNLMHTSIECRIPAENIHLNGITLDLFDQFEQFYTNNKSITQIKEGWKYPAIDIIAFKALFEAMKSDLKKIL